MTTTSIKVSLGDFAQYAINEENIKNQNITRSIQSKITIVVLYDDLRLLSRSAGPTTLENVVREAGGECEAVVVSVVAVRSVMTGGW